MDIWYLRVNAHLAEDHPRVSDIRGACVNCWVKASRGSEAENIALAEISNQRWIVEAIEQPPTADIERTEENTEYLLQAELDGECYVFYTYHREDEDPIH